MSNPAITLVPPRRYYDTATIAETHRRLQADGHNISENMLRGLVRQGVLPAVKLGRKALHSAENFGIRCSLRCVRAAHRIILHKRRGKCAKHYKKAQQKQLQFQDYRFLRLR